MEWVILKHSAFSDEFNYLILVLIQFQLFSSVGFSFWTEIELCELTLLVQFRIQCQIDFRFSQLNNNGWSLFHGESPNEMNQLRSFIQIILKSIHLNPHSIFEQYYHLISTVRRKMSYLKPNWISDKRLKDWITPLSLHSTHPLCVHLKERFQSAIRLRQRFAHYIDAAHAWNRNTEFAYELIDADDNGTEQCNTLLICSYLYSFN